MVLTKNFPTWHNQSPNLNTQPEPDTSRSTRNAPQPQTFLHLSWRISPHPKSVLVQKTPPSNTSAIFFENPWTEIASSQWNCQRKHLPFSQNDFQCQSTDNSLPRTQSQWRRFFECPRRKLCWRGASHCGKRRSCRYGMRLGPSDGRIAFVGWICRGSAVLFWKIFNKN